MKTISKIFLFLAFTVALALPLYGMQKPMPTTPTTVTLKDIRVNLEHATKQAGKRIAEAIKAKNSIAKSRMRESVKTITMAEQDEIIATIKQELLQLAENAIKIADETKKEESYLSQFMTGVQNFGAEMIAPFKAGYGTEHEKALARATITELENIKNKESDPKIIQELEKEIYAQKIISGEELGIQKKLLRGAALAAAGIAGVALTSRYLGAGAPSEPSMPSITPEQPSAPTPQDPVQEPVTVTEEPAPVQILPPSNITVEVIGEGRVEEPKKIDPINAAMEISSKLKEAHAEEQIAEEQKNVAEKDLESTQTYIEALKASPPKATESILAAVTPVISTPITTQIPAEEPESPVTPTPQEEISATENTIEQQIQVEKTQAEALKVKINEKKDLLKQIKTDLKEANKDIKQISDDYSADLEQFENDENYSKEDLATEAWLQCIRESKNTSGGFGELVSDESICKDCERVYQEAAQANAILSTSKARQRWNEFQSEKTGLDRKKQQLIDQEYDEMDNLRTLKNQHGQIERSYLRKQDILESRNRTNKND